MTMTKLTSSVLFFCYIGVFAAASDSSIPAPIKVNFPGRRYDSSDDVNPNGILGLGREFELFDTREALLRQHVAVSEASLSKSKSKQRPTSAYFPKSRSSSTSSSTQPPTNNLMHQVQEFWSTNFSNLPKLNISMEPTTTLKIRKTFRPLKTILRMGAEYNTQLGVWQFKTSWEDAMIGGKLTLAGRELQFTKSWQLKVGPVEDLVTRLRLRAAVDLQTAKAYCRVGFRQERLSPLNIAEGGFALQHKFNLDGADGHIKLELKANVALPEPELGYSTDNSKLITGLGDIDIRLEEANLLLDY